MLEGTSWSGEPQIPSGQDTVPIAKGAGLSPAQRCSLNHHQQVSIQPLFPATSGPDVLGWCLRTS